MPSAIGSNTPAGREIIFVASLAAPSQPTAAAKRLVRAAKTTQVRCYSCRRVFDAERMDPSTVLCEECLEVAGLENEHSDTGGKHQGKPVKGCPSCAS